MSSFLAPGTVLGEGKYLLGQKLGSGSHGDVYFGTDLQSDEVCFGIRFFVVNYVKSIDFGLGHCNKIGKLGCGTNLSFA